MAGPYDYVKSSVRKLQNTWPKPENQVSCRTCEYRRRARVFGACVIISFSLLEVLRKGADLSLRQEGGISRRPLGCKDGALSGQSRIFHRHSQGTPPDSEHRDRFRRALSQFSHTHFSAAGSPQLARCGTLRLQRI